MLLFIRLSNRVHFTELEQLEREEGAGVGGVGLDLTSCRLSGSPPGAASQD